jgi:NAD(P)-dependent dehydrogenase (short-subunit alcohol dehydrogenase family)
MGPAANKTIVITGISRGLGYALANKFAGLGHLVLGCARSAEKVRELAALLGTSHSISALDIAADEEVAAWAKRLLSTYPPPDLLINNAAVINKNAPLWQVSAEEFSQIVDINIKGVVNVIRHFVPAMIKQRTGIIVNVSSGWGRSTSPEVAPYCATKWAIEGLTQALAQELPSDMAAVAVNPGVINTEMLQSCFGSSASSYPSAEDWAERAAPFLLKLSARQNGKQLEIPA